MIIVKQQRIIPSKVADTVGFDRAIASLVKKELIYTEVIKSNQRSKAIYLTPLGAQLCEELISVFKRFSAHLYSSLAPQEKEVLINVFEKLIKSSQDYQL
jgi:DNA-binding MarR family transcriptional regulator